MTIDLMKALSASLKGASPEEIRAASVSSTSDDQLIEEGQASLDASQSWPNEWLEKCPLCQKTIWPDEPTELVVGKGESHKVCFLEARLAVLEPLANAYQRVQPNWFEKVTLAKRQEKLLRQTTRMIQLALATLENDIYATRVANASQYLEDALSDLDEYKMEGDPEEEADRLLDQLTRSVQATCKHPERIRHNEGRMPDNGEWFETFHCEACGAEWTEYE